MTFSDLFKVTIIQRQITWKRYNIQLYTQWPTNRKSYMICRTALFSMTLIEWPLPPASRSRHSLTLNIQEMVRHYRYSFNEILIGTYTRPTQQCHFEWPLSDLEWLSKIFNDMKSRAVSATAELLVSPYGCPIILVLSASNIFTTFRRGHPLRGAKYRCTVLQFSTNKSLYLANDTRQRHSYYGRRIGTRTRSIKWCHCQWPWTKPNPVFKVTPLFDAKYIANGYR